MEFIPKILWRFRVNIRIYKQYVKDFFLLNGILLKCWHFYFTLGKFKSILIDCILIFYEFKSDFENLKEIYEIVTN
jgi:hypothetical protein